MRRKKGKIIAYLIQRDDGMWIRVSKEVYDTWTGPKDLEREWA